MQPGLWLRTLGLGLIASASCSSTLDEFRCTENTECLAEQVAGMCHASGYCAFLDVEGCDGFRFGKHSGDQSGECVDAIGDVDASVERLPDGGVPGLPDASAPEPDAETSLTVPIANIQVPTLACDLTALTVDGSASQATDGTTLTNFAWQLKSPGGALITELTGDPGSGFTPNLGFVSGDVAHPRVNLTPYLDKHALFVVTAGGHSVIRQRDIALQAGNHTFSYAIGAVNPADVGQDIDVTIRSIADGSQQSLDASLSTAMTWHTINFSTTVDISDGQITIHSDTASYYLDNFRIHENSAGGSSQTPVVINPSLELGLAPWAVVSQTGAGASLADAEIPTSLKQYGQYELQLVVTDSDGIDSLPASVMIDHAACGGNNN